MENPGRSLVARGGSASKGLRKERLLAASVFLACCVTVIGADGRGRAASSRVNEGVVYLDQGWSQTDREMFYHVPQGSQAMSYDIFLALEVSESQDLFRSDANSDRYGLIPQPANPQTNPDGLAIGLAKSVVTEGRWKGETVGLTCAACHTAQLHYAGQRIRIDGGVASNFDLTAYVCALDGAMQATLADPLKFDRLAARLGIYDTNAKAKLRARFEGDAARVHEYRTHDLVTPFPPGPARIDAIALIVNRVTALEPDLPQNWSMPLAPTKPPFLWNAPQGTWTQWRASQQDPLRRDLVETMGVFMPMDLHSRTPQQGLFDSNADLMSLQRIEHAVRRLAPPRWPEEVLGKIDRDKALKGKALFVSICAGCHNAWPYTWTEPNKYGKRFIRVGLIPQPDVGTDPGQFEDFRPFAVTGPLGSQLPAPDRGKEAVPTGIFYAFLQDQVLAKALRQLTVSDEQTADLHGYREFPLPAAALGVYKAAPREGVWATPPFLHNGSVPNLYEMLLPARLRTKKFYLGREFDPVRVGLDTSGKSGKYLFDTSLPGNSNAGHSFEDAPRGNGVIGPLFTEEQRWELVEYLKSIPEQAGRVTPFGGPANER